jgi:hypothetical protein
MGWKGVAAGLAAVGLGVGALGCHKSAVQHKDPPDPLLVSKPPVEGRPHTAHASPLARTEPPPPPPGPAAPDRSMTAQRE